MNHPTLSPVADAIAAETFAILLGETARLWRTRLDERLKPLGLSQAKWLALLQLDRGGDRMTQTQLAARLGIEGPTLTALIDRLARDGYVRRREDDRDRRSKTVHLTPRAARVLKRITALAAELRQELLAGIPQGDLQVCVRTFKRIHAQAPNPHDIKNKKPGSRGEVEP